MAALACSLGSKDVSTWVLVACNYIAIPHFHLLAEIAKESKLCNPNAFYVFGVLINTVVLTVIFVYMDSVDGFLIFSCTVIAFLDIAENIVFIMESTVSLLPPRPIIVLTSFVKTTLIFVFVSIVSLYKCSY